VAEEERGFVELYRPQNMVQAEFFRLALQDAGIRSMVVGEYLQGVVGEVPMGWNSAPRLLVDPESVQAATAILEPLQKRQDAKRGESPAEPDDERCLQCGAKMGEAIVCDKCGWTFAPVPPQ